MNIQIFGTKKSSDARKAERWFKERRIRFQYIDLAEKGISKGELRSVAQAVGGIAALIDEKAKDAYAVSLVQHTPAAMLEDVLPRIDFSEPVEIFSQTTKSPDQYADICARVRSLGDRVTVHDTICAQVANRHEHLMEFARTHDLILFVAGVSSSNGKVLFDLCRTENPRTYRIGAPADIDPSWIRDGDHIGVCGATSTPKWLLEAVADAVRG